MPGSPTGGVVPKGAIVPRDKSKDPGGVATDTSDSIDKPA